MHQGLKFIYFGITLHVSDDLSVHYQEFTTVHTTDICQTDNATYVYWTVNHLDSWIKRDQLHVTCFFISLFNAQHVSDVNTSILRSLRLICWVISWVVLLWFDACWCYVVVWLGWCGIRMQAEALVLDICLSYVQSWTPDDERKDRPKHVELFQNK